MLDNLKIKTISGIKIEKLNLFLENNFKTINKISKEVVIQIYFNNETNEYKSELINIVDNEN